MPFGISVPGVPDDLLGDGQQDQPTDSPDSDQQPFQDVLAGGPIGSIIGMSGGSVLGGLLDPGNVDVPNFEGALPGPADAGGFIADQRNAFLDAALGQTDEQFSQFTDKLPWILAGVAVVGAVILWGRSS